MNLRLSSLLYLVLISGTSTLNAQSGSDPRSTEDLSFLVGSWEVSRVYSPGTNEARTYKGSLDCEMALDGKFIQCTYDMARPGKIRGLDLVFFNYNNIYEYYESVWFSSTWPIKTVMRIDLEHGANSLVMKTSGQFRIENDVMEYVKSELYAQALNGKTNTFTRQTYIRTSAYATDKWRHHMTERAIKK